MESSARDVTPENDEMVAAFMTRLVRAPFADAPRLPDDSVLLIKARLLRQWEAERTVQAPLEMMEPFQIAAGLAAAVFLFIWSLPSLLQLAGS